LGDVACADWLYWGEVMCDVYCCLCVDCLY